MQARSDRAEGGRGGTQGEAGQQGDPQPARPCVLGLPVQLPQAPWFGRHYPLLQIRGLAHEICQAIVQGQRSSDGQHCKGTGAFGQDQLCDWQSM